jgi:hypothetical protein
MLLRLLLLITLMRTLMLPSTGQADWINLTGGETSQRFAPRAVFLRLVFVFFYTDTKQIIISIEKAWLFYTPATTWLR